MPSSTPHATTAGRALSSRRATPSDAAREVSRALLGEEVRLDKIAVIQSALAAGTYSVPAAAMASRLVDAMLGGRW
jgi:negative regulator of flagellin synthesis FlgM